MAGTWAPYAGADAVTLAVVLLVVALFFAYLGKRLRNAVGTTRPGKAAIVLMLTVWSLSLIAFFVDSLAHALALQHANLVGVYQSYVAPNRSARSPTQSQ